MLRQRKLTPYSKRLVQEQSCSARHDIPLHLEAANTTSLSPEKSNPHSENIFICDPSYVVWPVQVSSYSGSRQAGRLGVQTRVEGFSLLHTV